MKKITLFLIASLCVANVFPGEYDEGATSRLRERIDSILHHKSIRKIIESKGKVADEEMQPLMCGDSSINTEGKKSTRRPNKIKVAIDEIFKPLTVNEIRCLIDKGANPNAKSKIDGSTLLHALAYSRNFYALQWVFKNVENVDINVKNNNGTTPLHQWVIPSVYDGLNRLARFVGVTGLCIGLTFTGLGLASLGACLGVTGLLAGNAPVILFITGASIGVPSGGASSLYAIFDSAHPVRTGCPKAIKYLIECGANTSAVDNDGSTPLELSLKNSKLKVIDLLLKKAPVNLTKKNYSKWQKNFEEFRKRDDGFILFQKRRLIKILNSQVCKPFNQVDKSPEQ